MKTLFSLTAFSAVTLVWAGCGGDVYERPYYHRPYVTGVYEERPIYRERIYEYRDYDDHRDRYRGDARVRHIYRTDLHENTVHRNVVVVNAQQQALKKKKKKHDDHDDDHR